MEYAGLDSFADFPWDTMEHDSHTIEKAGEFSTAYYNYSQVLNAAAVDERLLTPMQKAQIARDMWLDPMSPIDQGGLMLAITRQTHAVLSYLKDDEIAQPLMQAQQQMETAYHELPEEMQLSYLEDYRRRMNNTSAMMFESSQAQSKGLSLLPLAAIFAAATPAAMGAVNDNYALSRAPAMQQSWNQADQQSLDFANIAGVLKTDFDDILAGLNQSASEVTLEAKAAVVDAVDRNDPQYWQKKVAAERAAQSTAQEAAPFEPKAPNQGEEGWQDYMDAKIAREAAQEQDEQVG